MQERDTNDTKRQTKESINKITEAELYMYLGIMDAKTTQDKKERIKHIQQVTEQNATLLSLEQEKQKMIEELMMQSKILIKAMTNKNQQKEHCKAPQSRQRR